MNYTMTARVFSIPVRLRSDGARLTGLELGREGVAFPELPGTRECPELALFDAVRRWLDDYAAGRRPDPGRLPLAPEGSPFARTVWEILLTVPYGETLTYGEVARRAAARLGKTRMAAQAVGQAVGANPIAIVIPCHRVMGAHGRLTGYGGGLARKVALLKHEGAATEHLIWPQGKKWHPHRDSNPGCRDENPVS